MTEATPHIALISNSLDLTFLKEPLQGLLPNATFSRWPQDDVREAEIAICWKPPAGLLASLPKLRMIHSIAAGLDNIFADPQLPDVPVCRVVDRNHAEGMAEYALWATLLFQRKMDDFLRNAQEKKWDRPPQVRARDYRVGILGFGAIGRVVGERLTSLGYPVRGWARSQRDESGVEMFFGPDGLDAFLSGCDLLICLLPLTTETGGILNASLFNHLPHGAALVNMGRGEHLVESDLLAALDSGQLRGAVLDVFPEEPLPNSSPLWDHSRVFITPHIASMPDPKDAARQIAKNALLALEGKPLLNAGDPKLGY